MTDNIKMPPVPESIFHGCGELWPLIDKWSRADPGFNASVAANAIDDAITRLMNKHAIEAVRLNAQAVPDVASEFNRAIDFAIEQGSEAASFLRSWREGDVSEWPEFPQLLSAVVPQLDDFENFDAVLGRFEHKERGLLQAQMAAPQTSQPAQTVSEISTEHGPWVESNIHEGETYCRRCLVRSVFAGHKKCEPHIVSAPAAPKPAQQPLTDEQIANALGFGEYTVESTKATLTAVARAIEQAHGIGVKS